MMKNIETPFDYRPGGGSMASDVPDKEDGLQVEKKSDDKPLSWTASEYIDHNNGLGWYALLALLTLAVAAVIYLLTKEVLSAATVLILGVIIAIAAVRRPEQITYELSVNGIKTGERFHTFSHYRSFYIHSDGDLRSISLMPIKRFAPALSIYFDPADEKMIVDKLSRRLPFEEHRPEMIDRLSRRLRF